MAQIIRLVWRLDYEVSYAYMDKRGTALRALADTVEKFWDVVGDGTVGMSFAGNATRDGRYRNISLEPTSLNGALEWSSGTDFERVLKDDSFRSVDRIVRDLLKICEVKVMARAGIRMFCISNFADGKHGKDRTINLLDKSARETTSSTLGPIDDTAYILEGKTPDKLSYRVMYGPYAQKNLIQSLQSKPSVDAIKILSESDLFFDIDLYETNFSFLEHSLFRWSETKVAKAVEFIALTSGDLNKNLGGK